MRLLGQVWRDSTDDQLYLIVEVSRDKRSSGIVMLDLQTGETHGYWRGLLSSANWERRA